VGRLEPGLYRVSNIKDIRPYDTLHPTYSNVLKEPSFAILKTRMSDLKRIATPPWLVAKEHDASSSLGLALSITEYP
jgi:hypothetical protein